MGIIPTIDRAPGRHRDGACLAVLLATVATAGEADRYLAEDPGNGDVLGIDVAILGDTVLVGAPLDDDNGAFSGSAYLFDRASGAQLHKLLAPDGLPSHIFGTAVELTGTLALVGAPNADGGTGAVYLFDPTTGAPAGTLTPDEGDPEAFFGTSIAVRGSTAYVGATGVPRDAGLGKVYAFNLATGAQTGVFVPEGADASRDFGRAVAASGGFLLVGASDDTNGEFAGAAYLFDAATGTQLAKILPDDGGPREEFGNAVAILGDRAVIAAWRDDDQGTEAGSVYLYDITNPDFPVLITELSTPSLDDRDDFGQAVTISSERIIVGAPGDENETEVTGSYAIFELMNGEFIARVLPEEGRSTESFGFSIDGDGANLAIGAPFTDIGGAIDAGAAHAGLTSVPCSPVDLARPFGFLDLDDIVAYVVAFGDQDPVADLAPPFGFFDLDDIVAFVTIFGEGCP
jgi:hypothetical protein